LDVRPDAECEYGGGVVAWITVGDVYGDERGAGGAGSGLRR
jgi:hypothetical protein